MKRTPPEIQDTLDKMARAKSEKAAREGSASVPFEKLPRSRRWMENLATVILIVAALLVFGVLSVVAQSFFPSGGGFFFGVIGSVALLYFLRSLARK